MKKLFSILTFMSALAVMASISSFGTDIDTSSGLEKVEMSVNMDIAADILVVDAVKFSPEIYPEPDLFISTLDDTELRKAEKFDLTFEDPGRYRKARDGLSCNSFVFSKSQAVNHYLKQMRTPRDGINYTAIKLSGLHSSKSPPVG